MAEKYHELSKAHLACDYLHANSTTHEFLFGALAELVDNARDAEARLLNIYTEISEELKGGFMLCFLDDGIGMDPNEAADIIHLGKSMKRISDSQLIGQYGNGLKSGSMRIGVDFILFTKKDNTMTCILMSRTFYEKEGIDEVIVPVPSWSAATREPIITDEKKFALEIALIHKYSPFKKEFDVMQQFNKITGASGTLVVIYNLKLNDDGVPELDIETDPSDIRLTGMMASGIQPELYSFRAYAAILYINPRMKISIQGEKVHAQHLIFSLYRPRKYIYISKGFKVRASRELKEAELAVKIAEESMQEAKFKLKELEKTCDSTMEAENQFKFADAHSSLLKSQRDVDRKKNLYQEKLRALKDPHKLTFTFGVNIEKRNLDGMFIYNNSRLIKMYKRIGVQLNRMLRSCSGVVGIVDVPSIMMEPTHNKQDFADAKEYHSLLRVMGQFLLQYWKDLGIAQMGVVKFWNEFGYTSANWNLPPSNALQFRRRRASEIHVIVQCDFCLCWRNLPSYLDINERVLSDIWVCPMNHNPRQNSCDVPEQLPHIPLGTPVRGSVCDERQELLEQSVRRHWEKAAALQLQKTFPIKPLTYKLPPDLSNKSISKGIAASESNAFSLPSSTRKRPIPSFYTQRNRRSESTERSPLSWTKQCKLPRNGKTGRIHGKRRSAAVSSEKRSYNSQNSTEENVITKTFLASLPRMKHLQKEQANPYNFKVEILQRDLSKETTKTAPDSNVYSREPTSSSNYTTLVKNEALKDGDTVRSTCCRWEVKENEIVSSGSERFQVKNMQDSSAGGSLAAPCSIANHMDMKKPGISNETVKGIVTCFRNLLSHFIPPNYHISKEKVNLLTAEELVIFPLHHYFFHYEKSLRERFQSSSENVITRAQEVEVEQKMHQAVAKLEDTKEKLKCSQNVFVQLLNKPITLQSEESKLLEELVKSFEKDAKSSNVVSD